MIGSGRGIFGKTLWLLALAIVTPALASDLNPSAFLADPAPRKLSAYGLFANTTAQLPNAGLVPYNLISQLHSDYSEKFRFLYVPEGQAARYRSEGLLELPVGSALIKTFAYPASDQAGAPMRLLETRLLVHLPAGWQARVYVWNPEQTEAEYKAGGKTIWVDWLDVGGVPGKLRYRVPNLNQCTTCHSRGQALLPLGPKARNLDQMFDYSRFGLTHLGERNQLAAWTELGILTGANASARHDRVADWADTSADLNRRARAYLDINCSHCHHPQGTAASSGLFLHWEEHRRVHLGIGKRPVAAGRGTGNRKHDLVPGHPDDSIMLFRMQSTEAGVRMPEIALTRQHREGIELIRDWILSLD